jgi:hypothetical protein
MELTAEQNAKFKALCREIKPGEFGKIVVSFSGNDFVQITGEKNFRFHNTQAEVTHGNVRGGQDSDRIVSKTKKYACQVLQGSDILVSKLRSADRIRKPDRSLAELFSARGLSGFFICPECKYDGKSKKIRFPRPSTVDDYTIHENQ